MLVRFKITFWDEVDKTTRTESGLISSTSEKPGEVVNELYEFYGYQNVNTLIITEWDSILTDSEIIEGLKEDI